MDHEQLFSQATRLATPSRRGPPPQADVKRAFSAAYYGLFHFTLASLADFVVGRRARRSPLYALVYRSIEHRTLLRVCRNMRSADYLAHAPVGGFGPHLMAFSSSAIELQQLRHEADYDPLSRFAALEARSAVRTARDAVEHFRAAPPPARKAFLTLLLCQPR